MIIKNIENQYKQNITEYTKSAQKLKKKTKWLVIARLLFFSMALYFLIAGIKNNFNYLFLALSVFSFAFFILVVKQSMKFAKKIKYLTNLSLINSNEINALQYNFSCFDGGDEFSDPSHPFAYDLDIFGKESVFAQINRTVSKNGKKKLANWLCNPLIDVNDITKRQEAIKELSQYLYLRQDFIALGKERNENDNQREQILQWIDIKLPGRTIQFMKTAAILFSFISFITIILTIAGLISYLALFLLLFINGTLIFSQIKIINKEHARVSRQYDMIIQFSEQIKLIENSDFKAEKLVIIKNKIYGNDMSGSKAIKQLASIINAFDYRLNLLVSIVLTGFFFWDFFCMLRLHKWKTKHNEQLHQWFDALDEFDAIQSISNFYFNNPSYIFATFNYNEEILTGKNIGHPQIIPEKRVLNDLNIDNKGTFLIITGPNMAGKSTFLRTIGVLFVCAQSGIPICANFLNIRPVKLYTSMRTSDSLYKNESYFFAELKRLQEIINASTKQENIFIILDEILKGTNSKDKAEGSKGFMKKIISLKATGLVATHDLSLGELENDMPENILNFCFEVATEGKEITYNYLLKRGITTKMNASFLMKQMGII